jgi:hypothetical protein
MDIGIFADVVPLFSGTTTLSGFKGLTCGEHVVDLRLQAVEDMLES